MTAVRLDPADPIASVLAWLAELARALGLDPAQRAPRVPPTREVAAAVRAVLADWSRQLRALVWAKALRLARGLATGLRAKTSDASPATQASGAPEGRLVGERKAGGRVVLIASPGRLPPRCAARPQAAAVRRAPDTLLDPAAAAALKARTRAVYLALLDPSVLIRRLARRLARAGACPEPARFPRPPRAAGLAPSTLARKPELRPPKRSAAVQPAARPAVLAAAPLAHA